MGAAKCDPLAIGRESNGGRLIIICAVSDVAIGLTSLLMRMRIPHMNIIFPGSGDVAAIG